MILPTITGFATGDHKCEKVVHAESRRMCGFFLGLDFYRLRFLLCLWLEDIVLLRETCEWGLASRVEPEKRYKRVFLDLRLLVLVVGVVPFDDLSGFRLFCGGLFGVFPGLTGFDQWT
jgi:hypothetical protein